MAARRKTDSTIKILYHQVKPDIYTDGKKTKAGLDCPDGIAAAWCALRKYPTATLVGCAYGAELPIVDNGDLLIIVDFSFEVEVIKSWQERDCKIVLIDHHKTLVDKVNEYAEDKLFKLFTSYVADSILVENSLKYKISLETAVQRKSGLPKENPILVDFLEYLKLVNFWFVTDPVIPKYIEEFLKARGVKRVFKYFSDSVLSFDIAKCGAVLTWEYFFPDEPVPAFLLYIQDRDIWAWLQPKSKEINEAFGHMRFGTTRNKILEEMDRFYSMTQNDLIYHFECLGSMLLAPKLERSKEIAKRAHWVEAWGYRFLACPINPRDINNPEDFQIANDAYYYNDVMEILYTENHDSPFVCTYIELPDNAGYKLSLRSRQQYDSFDVSKLARSLGGGGHREAAAGIIQALPWESK